MTIYNYFIKVCSSIFLKVCLANILFSYCSAPLKSIKAKWSSYKHFFTWILLVSLDSIIAYFQLNLLGIQMTQFSRTSTSGKKVFWFSSSNQSFLMQQLWLKFSKCNSCNQSFWFCSCNLCFRFKICYCFLTQPLAAVYTIIHSSSNWCKCSSCIWYGCNTNLYKSNSRYW